MSSPVEDSHVDGTVALFLRDLDLSNSSILVVLTLNDSTRHADIGEVFGDVPVAKLLVEPGAIPPVKSVVDVFVPARELVAEVGIFVGDLDLGDRSDRDVLDDEVRRDQRDGADTMILHAAGIDRRDRSAVGMADEQAALE